MALSRAVAHREVLAALLVMLAGGAAGCSRSGLGELSFVDGNGAGAGPIAAATLDASPAAGGAAALPPILDAGTVPTASAPASQSPPVANEPHCTPTDEVCNGKDDDCNGKVDDGLPAIPCAGGGEQYCVAGRYSACPQRCETCVPGTERVCFLSYCTFWATETCAADGRGFGNCREGHVPSECADVSEQHKDSAELEQCCIDTGHCCRDEFDLDGDGDHDEMLGRCDEVSCHP